MENQKDSKEQNLQQVGSNLTGAVIAAKPGHQRDIAIEQYQEPEDQEENNLPAKHMENTDALIGDVHPTVRNQKSQEELNANEENRS